jgi:hypothetical protein
MSSIEIEGLRFELLYKTTIYQTYKDSTTKLKKGKHKIKQKENEKRKEKNQSREEE